MRELDHKAKLSRSLIKAKQSSLTHQKQSKAKQIKAMAGFSSTTCLLLIFLLLRSSEARDILVGGKADAWAIPSSESQSLNKWAETNRFRTGDTLGKLIINSRNL